MCKNLQYIVINYQNLLLYIVNLNIYLLIKKQSNESMGEKYFLRAFFHWLIHYKIKAIIQIRS